MKTKEKMYYRSLNKEFGDRLLEGFKTHVSAQKRKYIFFLFSFLHFVFSVTYEGSRIDRNNQRGGVFHQRETDRGGDKISGGHGDAVRQTDGSVARRDSRR